MQIPVFDFSNAVGRALGWTLIHSMWQGIVVALLTAILLRLSQHRSAQTRYQIAYCALMSLLAMAIYDFISAYPFEIKVENHTGMSVYQATLQPVKAGTSIVQLIDNPFFTEKFSDFLNRFLNEHLSMITLAWSIGFCFFGLQLSYSWWMVRRYQRRGGIPLDAFWQAQLQCFQQPFSNNRPIQLLEVAWTQVPLTIGWLKPIIFVPIGMVNRLQPADVEAILAHELAHIIKNDYFFNFLQAVVEVLFYYHPAVWWLSSVIRAEREMRCDDMAIAICGNNRLAYAKTLVQLQSQFDDYQANSKLALHFKKQPSLLFRRIQRIFSPPIKHSEKMDKMMITGLLFCGMFLMAVAKNSDIQTIISNKTVQNEQSSVKIKKTVDSLPLKIYRKEMIIMHSDSVEQAFHQQNILIDTIFTPEKGKVQIIKSVYSESYSEKNDSVKIMIGSMDELKQHPAGSVTITKQISKDGKTKIDTVRWNGKKESTRVENGNQDTKIVVGTTDDPMLKSIEKELLHDALITNTRKYEFKLDDKNLYINGELMDKRIYDKYKQFHNLLTTKSLGNAKFGLTISKNDTTSHPTALAPFNASVPKMLSGHCYALCRLENGGYEEAWREVLCQNLVTPEVIKLVITKLKADGSLAATESATEFTKETQNALTAYQKKHKLPQGNLNLETVKHMDITVK